MRNAGLNAYRDSRRALCTPLVVRATPLTDLDMT
jgi:hypothetical protein